MSTLYISNSARKWSADYYFFTDTITYDTVHCALYTVYCALCTLHCALCTVQSLKTVTVFSLNL